MGVQQVHLMARRCQLQPILCQFGALEGLKVPTSMAPCPLVAKLRESQPMSTPGCVRMTVPPSAGVYLYRVRSRVHLQKKSPCTERLVADETPSTFRTMDGLGWMFVDLG